MASYRYVQDNRGRRWVTNLATRDRMEVTGPGQAKAAEQLYGQLQTTAPGGGPIFLTGFNDRGQLVDYINNKLGVKSHGLEMIVAGKARDPLGTYLGGAGPRPPGAPAAPPRGTVGSTTGNRNFRQEIKTIYPWWNEADDLLDVYMESWSKSGNAELAMGEVRKSSLYQKYFPGNVAKGGGPRLSENAYMKYADQWKTLARKYGITPGVGDTPEIIGRAIQNDLSINEASERMGLVYRHVMAATSEDRAELARQNIGTGDLMAYAIDPSAAMEKITFRLAQAQIGAEAVRTGFGQIGLDEQARLAGMGITREQARAGFGQASADSELYQGLAGTGEGAIGTNEVLDATFAGDIDARRRIQARREARVGRFSRVGGSVVTEKGLNALANDDG